MVVPRDLFWVYGWLINLYNQSSHSILRSRVRNLCFQSEMKREDPLNLSILIRGGKETNKDSLSNGE
jgi:hypothetical protein